jgi:hypothetical protein
VVILLVWLCVFALVFAVAAAGLVLGVGEADVDGVVQVEALAVPVRDDGVPASSQICASSRSSGTPPTAPGSEAWPGSGAGPDDGGEEPADGWSRVAVPGLVPGCILSNMYLMIVSG